MNLKPPEGGCDEEDSIVGGVGLGRGRGYRGRRLCGRNRNGRGRDGGELLSDAATCPSETLGTVSALPETLAASSVAQAATAAAVVSALS